MKVFISGGCKNGKSSHAERLAVKLFEKKEKTGEERGFPLYYIATMIPKDGEDKERIERHRMNREGLGFQTVEIPAEIIRLKELCDFRGVLLLDSVTALLSNEMFPESGRVNMEASKKVAHELLEIIDTADDIVIVSDYIYSDAIFYEELTERFREGLAYADRLCAAACNTVIEVCCGSAIVYKGEEGLAGLGVI